MSHPTLDTPLPSGGWKLYFHPAKETRWHMDTFKCVYTLNTFRDLAYVFAALTPTDWSRGKFFFTPTDTPPLMENARNIRGGSYSIRIERPNVGPIMQRYIVAAVLGTCLTSPEDKLACVRITPRRDFNILQIWNRDCEKFANPLGLRILDPKIPVTEVKYVPHVEKKI
jgi:hypothetical protein